MKKRNAKKGAQLTYIISKTINHFFPNLFDRIRKIEDCRKKSEYELVELITACIAMFIFKEGSRNAFNNDRDEENFKENYKNLFHMRLPHMDTVDNVMRQLNENELEKLKTDMICNLLKKKSLKRRDKGKRHNLDDNTDFSNRSNLNNTFANCLFLLNDYYCVNDKSFRRTKWTFLAYSVV